MGKARVPSIEDEVNKFKDVMRRCSLQDYVYVDRIMISKNPKNQSVLILPDQELWNKLTDDQDFMKSVKEMNAIDPDRDLIKYGDMSMDGWLEVDPTAISNGTIFKIKVEPFVYELLINKNMIPLKLKKAELNNIYYKVFSNPYVLAIKKKFDSPIEGASFSIIRLMKIL